MNIGDIKLITAGKINIPAIKGDTGTGIKGLDILENGDLIVHLDNGTESNAGNINKIASANLVDGQLIITTTGGEEHNAGNVYDDELILERINRFNSNADTKTTEFNENCVIRINEYNDFVEISKNEIETQKTNSITQIQEVSQKEKDDISKTTEVINSRLSGLEEKEHTHANKALVDSLTEENIEKYNTGYEHSQSLHAPSNAQENVIEVVKVNGIEQPIEGKSVNITIGTEEFAQMINQVILESDKKKYPIGKIEMNTSGANPNTYLGFGTWIAWGSGRVPVGVDTNDTDFNTSEKTGGSKTIPLTTANLPSHSHTYTKATGTASIKLKATQCALVAHTHKLAKGFYTYVGTGGSVLINSGTNADFISASNASTTSTSTTEASESHNHSITSESTSTGNVGSGTPINVQQKYITCYMWKRTA